MTNGISYDPEALGNNRKHLVIGLLVVEKIEISNKNKRFSEKRYHYLYDWFC